ncbi:hypothetical protein EBS80_02270 [bacterium]|nr:hypothetical protein [bacterium]
MIATLLAVILSFVPAAHAVEASPADAFKAAAFDASQAVGTAQFKAAFTTAQFRCDDAVAGCGEILAKLKAADAAARKPAVVAPPPSPVADAEEEADVPSSRDGYGTFIPVDQPTGLEYVASTSRLPEPWTGYQVNFFTSRANWVQMVCIMKEGAPLPVGGEIPISKSSTRGSPVQGCPATPAPIGGSLRVPANSQIYLMTVDPLRQVYVVREIRRTGAGPDYHDGLVQEVSITDLPSINMSRR